MEYKIEKSKVDEVFEEIKYFESFLTERISDLHEVKLGMTERHCFVFYRKLLWGIRRLLEENMTPLPEPPKE